jgi:hypothetical protein
MKDVSRGCELFRGASVVGTTPTPYPSTGNLCGSERVTVPYGVWSKGGGSARIVMPFVGAASPHVIARPSNESLVVASGVERGVLGSSRNATDGTAWVELSVRYVGSTTLSGTSVLVAIMVDHTMMVCGVSSGGAAVDVVVWLEPAPPVPPDVGTTVDVGVLGSAVGGAVLGVPSGIVRAGIANSMADMLVCAEFDPTGDIDLISNPLSWAVGREELQYQRGSLLLTMILVVCAGVVSCVTLMGFYVSNRGGGVSGAVRRARLPSLPLCAILLACEVAVSPGVNVLLYEGSRSEDYVLALCVLIPLAVFLGLYAYRASVGMRVLIEKVPEADGVVAGGTCGALLRFALEPSHRPVSLEEETNKGSQDNDDDEDGVQVGDGERWLRGNFYFVAEKRWAAYGAIEAIVGPLVGVLEGIPMTTRSKAACIGRPAAMSVLLILLLTLLLWRHPFAVRLQQWTSVIVTGGLLIASALVVANGIAPSEELQNGAGRVIGIVSIVIMLFGAIDVVTLLLSLVPSLRVKLGIKARSLQESLDYIVRGRMLTSDLLFIAAQRPTDVPPPTLEEERSSVSDDEDTMCSSRRASPLDLRGNIKDMDLGSNESSISDFGDLEVEDEAAGLAADNSFAGVALQRLATTIGSASAPTTRYRSASTTNKPRTVDAQRPRRSLSMARRPNPRPATPEQENDNEELSTMQVCLKMEEEDDDFAELMEDPTFALYDTDDDEIEL